MLSHEELMKLHLVRFATGELVSIETDTNSGQVVFAKGSVAPEFENLLQASALLYQTLEFQRKRLNLLIDMAKLIGADPIIPRFEEMLGPIEFAKMIAVDGLENYVKKEKQ